MKKSKLLIFLFLMFAVTDVKATENKEYRVGDYVYYNPVNQTTCNYKKYWTTTNQKETCYRFLVIEDSKASNTTVKVMLNHNYINDTYNNYKTQLNNIKSSWTRYQGNMNIISEDEVYSLMKLSKKPGFNSDGTAESIHTSSGATLLALRENAQYFIDGKRYNTAGFWTNTSHEKNSSYAYSVTEYGNNRPLLKTEKRGIRPVITLNKSDVTDDKTKVNLQLSEFSNYQFLDNNFDGCIYKQMQGFTMANDKLFFYSSNNSNPTKGILFGYGEKGYKTQLGYLYGNMGHGNDMTYNSKTDKILLVGPDEYETVWEFTPSTFQNGASRVIKIKEILGSAISAIGYDKLDDRYFVRAYGSALVTDSSFAKTKDSFPISHTETGQGLDYNNGYLYVTSFEIGETAKCPGTYQVYCYDEEDSGTIYVYNAKYNSDGTPSPYFGTLVARYKTPTGLGEIETVSFKDNKMYLGYASKKYDSTNTYKIYTTTTNVLQSPTYSIKYTGGTAIITSKEDIKPVSDWTLSSDKKTLSKTLTSSDKSVKICDRYGNCKDETLKTLDTITLQDNTTTYTGNKITVNNATSKSNSDITYKYYSDESCKNEIQEIINTGNYSVKATSVGNSDYASNSKCSKLTVNRGNPIISLEPKETNYNGKIVEPNTPTAKAPNNKTNVTLEYTYKYYSDNTCKSAIDIVPINAGNYYVKATSKLTNNLNQASSSCTNIKINKINPKLTIDSNVKIPLNIATGINFNTNSKGNITCKSSNDAITCKIEEEKLILTAKKKENASITLIQDTDTNYNKIETTINVAVNDIETDNVKPTISFSPAEDKNYTKTKQIKISIEDKESYIPGNQVLYYAVTSSNTERPYYEKTLTLSSVDERTKTIELPQSDFENLTGTYYIWIKSGIKDANNNETVETISKEFNFNNTKPEVKASAVKTKNKTKITLNINSLSKIKKKSYSFTNDSFSDFNSNNLILNSGLNDKIYISVVDELNQSNLIELNIDNEEKTILESYILDNDKLLENNLIDLNKKAIVYNLNIRVPKIERIVEKYKMFEIKTTIDKNITFNKNNIKVFNKSNEDVTSNFKISDKDNVIYISTDKVNEDTFYDENYNIKIQARINDNYKPETDSNKFISSTSLVIDDNEISKKEVSSSIKYEELENVPNTAMNFKKISLFFGFIFVIIGISIFINQINNKTEN